MDYNKAMVLAAIFYYMGYSVLFAFQYDIMKLVYVFLSTWLTQYTCCAKVGFGGIWYDT